MQVTNEIRQAFLFAALNLNSALGETPNIDKITVQVYLNTAFEATETDELMKWLTLQEKVAFGRKLLELTAGRDLNSDLTEDR